MFNSGNASLVYCTVTGNSSGTQGGGVYNVTGTTTLTDTIVAQNQLGAAARERHRRYRQRQLQPDR